MKAKDFMTRNPECCTPDTMLQEVARLMVECDCGCIPVVDDTTNRRLIGVITDRDITCRAVSRGINPLDLTARDCMTPNCVTVKEDTSLGDICDVLEEHKIRRVCVTDQLGRLTGIIAQADIAECASKRKAGEVVRVVSQHDSNHSSPSFTRVGI